VQDTCQERDRLVENEVGIYTPPRDGFESMTTQYQMREGVWWRRVGVGEPPKFEEWENTHSDKLPWVTLDMFSDLPWPK